MQILWAIQVWQIPVDLHILSSVFYISPPTCIPKVTHNKVVFFINCKMKKYKCILQKDYLQHVCEEFPKHEYIVCILHLSMSVLACKYSDTQTKSNMTTGTVLSHIITIVADPPHLFPWCVCRTLSRFPPSFPGYKQTSLWRSGPSCVGHHLSAALCPPIKGVSFVQVLAALFLSLSRCLSWHIV